MQIGNKVKAANRTGVLVGIWGTQGFVVHYLPQQPSHVATGNAKGETPSSIINQRPIQMVSYALTDIEVLDNSNLFAN